MWYPTLPDVIYLHEQICALQEVEAKVNEMSAIDEAILAPQRTGLEERSRPVVARKLAALLAPLVKFEPFSNCNDRVAHSVGQRFADRNGFVLQPPYPKIVRSFDKVRSGDVSLDTYSSWLETQLSTRFDARHRDRILSCLNQLAQLKQSLERKPGVREETRQMDGIGYTLTQQIGTLFRLEDETDELRDRFPLFCEAWEEALPKRR